MAQSSFRSLRETRLFRLSLCSPLSASILMVQRYPNLNKGTSRNKPVPLRFLHLPHI